MLILKDEKIYLQIYNYFKNEIIKGNYKANSKMPSRRELAKEYGVSKNSVENAYAKLSEEGYIYSKERSGYFVTDLEGIIVLSEITEEVEEVNEVVDVDFTFQGVCEEGFPFSTLRKITSNLMDDRELLYKVDYQGYFTLRSQICQYLDKSRGFSVKPEQVVISSGSEYLFQMLFKILDGVYALEDPGYTTIREMLRINRIPFIDIPLDDSGISFDDLKKCSADILVVTPAHQYPTGIIMSTKRRLEILNSKKITYIIEDDYDGEFKYSKGPVPALKSMDTTDKVIYLGSFSKALSPSIRISYMVLPESLLKRYEKIYSGFVCPVPLMVQKMMSNLISEGEFEKHLNRMRKIYSRKRQLIVDLVSKRSDLKVKGADAGLHLIIEFPDSYLENSIIKKAMEKGVKIKGIGTSLNKGFKPQILISFSGLTDDKIVNGINKILEI